MKNKLRKTGCLFAVGLICLLSFFVGRKTAPQLPPIVAYIENLSEKSIFDPPVNAKKGQYVVVCWGDTKPMAFKSFHGDMQIVDIKARALR